MKVFLDTNIILDLLLERDGFEASADILQMREDGWISLFASILTMANIAFVYRKTVGPAFIAPNMKYISALIEVLPMGPDCLQKAIDLDGKDFEDAMQAACAAEGGCDCIITRNVKDYKFCRKGNYVGVPKVFTPVEFLAQNQS